MYQASSDTSQATAFAMSSAVTECTGSAMPKSTGASDSRVMRSSHCRVNSIHPAAVSTSRTGNEAQPFFIFRLVQQSENRVLVLTLQHTPSQVSLLR